MRVQSSHTSMWLVIGKNSYFSSLAVVWIVPVHTNTHWLYECACCHIMLNVKWLFMALTSPYHHYTMLQLNFVHILWVFELADFSRTISFQTTGHFGGQQSWNAPAALFFFFFFFIVLNASLKPLSCPLPFATCSEMHNTKCTWSSLGWISRRASFIIFFSRCMEYESKPQDSTKKRYSNTKIWAGHFWVAYINNGIQQ